MRLGAAKEWHSAAAAADGCLTSDFRSPEVDATLGPSAVQWQTTAPLRDDPSAMAPVDFDPADAYDVSIAAGTDEPQLACELASRADASLRADIQQRLRVMAF